MADGETPHSHETFELVLKDGCPYKLCPEPGYNLVLTHVALECEHSDDPNVDVAYNAKGNVSLLWKDSEREFLALVLNPTSGPHKKLRLVFNNEVELVARGGNLTAFLFFHLVNVSKLVRTYVDENEDSLPKLSDGKCTWTTNPQFYDNVGFGRLGRLSKSMKRSIRMRNRDAAAEEDVAPQLVMSSPAAAPTAKRRRLSVASSNGTADFALPPLASDGSMELSLSECADVVDEPTAREEPDVTPPRLLTLVASSSPERSASRSSAEDEGVDYLVRVPEVKAEVGSPLKLASKRSKAVPTAALPAPSSSPLNAPPAPAPRKEPATVRSPVSEPSASFETVKSPRMRPNKAPRGVLKKRSRLAPLDAPSSPQVTPRAAPSADPHKRGVVWNPQSPDVRFITPPLSAIHRAFPGGLLDLGFPMLTQPQRAGGVVHVSHTSQPQTKRHVPLGGLSNGAVGGRGDDGVRVHDVNSRPLKAYEIAPPNRRPTVL